MSTHPSDHVLAYVGQKKYVIRFIFDGRKWSLLTFIVAFVALYFSANYSEYSQWLKPGGLIVFCLFQFATLWNFFSRRCLEFRLNEKILNDEKVNLFERKHFQIPFTELTGLRIYRNSTGRAGRSVLVRIALETKEGDYAILGTTHIGTPSLKQARNLARELGESLGLPITEEPSATRSR